MKTQLTSTKVPAHAAPNEEIALLGAQQVAAKEAAHQRFDTPASLRTIEKTEAAVLNTDGSIHDEI